MVARNPQGTFEEALAGFTDEQLEAQERQYEADMARLSFLLNAVRATKEARKVFAGSEDPRAASAHRPRTLIDAVRRVMLTAPDKAWTADVILDRLQTNGWAPKGQTPKNSVDATLSRMVRDGIIERIDRGVYMLADTDAVAGPLDQELGRALA